MSGRGALSTLNPRVKPKRDVFVKAKRRPPVEDVKPESEALLPFEEQLIKGIKAQKICTSYIARSFRTERIRVALVRQNLLNVNDMEDDEHTDAVDKAIVEILQKDGHKLLLISPKRKRQSHYWPALHSTPSAVYYIPADDQKPEHHMYAVQQHPLCLEYIPELFRTTELCVTAVMLDDIVTRHVPEKIREQVIEHVKTSLLNSFSNPDNVLLFPLRRLCVDYVL